MESSLSVSPAPKRLKEMTADQIAATLADDARLIIPVGTCERYHPSLPIGCATIIAERLADDLSAEFSVLRAPTVEYGVNAGDLDTSSKKSPAGYPGRVAVRKKTLHRLLNDMLAAWECHGVNEFILLTAHAHDPHQEAIDTVATTRARVRVVDLFAVNLSDLLKRPTDQYELGNVFLSLMLYLAPTLVRNMTVGDEGTADQGRALYERIRARVSERIFLAPVPSE
jgi:creatinine amidohydrolase/Fe(II)-dependent formamide hydrolase-like protein